MRDWAARVAKRVLSHFERTLVYTPEHALVGLALDQDLPKIVRKADPLCLDIGANRGQTVQLLSKCFASPQIHSFEPSPEAFAILKKTYGSNPRVMIHQTAMGDEPGEKELNRYKSSKLDSFLELESTGYEYFNYQAELVERVPVKVATVDGFLEERGLGEVDLLKIDTQGFDLHVLRGARASLEAGRVAHIMIELNFAGVYRGQDSPFEIMELLSSRFGLVDMYEKQFKHGRMGWCTAVFSKV